MAFEMVVELLGKGHDRAGFDCGVEPLNSFLQKHARKNAQLGFSRTYVLVEQGSPSVLAYCTIASGEFDCEHLPIESRKGAPRHPVPVVRLCRLASDIRQRGKGFGELMLVDALRRAELLSTQLGVHAIEVDALGATARAFYVKYGFRSLRDDLNHLYLPVKSLKLPE